MTLAPSPISARRVAALLLALGVALGAAGCGRRGDLEPPPSPNAVAPTPSPTGDPLAAMSHHKDQPITPPKGPFALDPLL